MQTDFAANYLTGLSSALTGIDLTKVNTFIALLEKARTEDRQVFFCGNGGSAATANHMACDFLKGCSYGKPKRFRVISLSESIPTMTAYSNDVSYDKVFVEQLKNFAQPGDVFVAISGSGNSANVVEAMSYANEIGCETVALSGFEGGKIGPMANLHINVPSDHMGRIEDGHMVIMHMACYHFMDTEAG